MVSSRAGANGDLSVPLLKRVDLLAPPASPPSLQLVGCGCRLEASLPFLIMISSVSKFSGSFAFKLIFCISVVHFILKVSSCHNYNVSFRVAFDSTIIMYLFVLLFTPSCRLTNDNIKSSSLPAETAGIEGSVASTTQNILDLCSDVSAEVFLLMNWVLTSPILTCSDAEYVLETPQKGGKLRLGGGRKKAAALVRLW
jgi:hypothetical protein